RGDGSTSDVAMTPPTRSTTRHRSGARFGTARSHCQADARLELAGLELMQKVASGAGNPAAVTGVNDGVAQGSNGRDSDTASRCRRPASVAFPGWLVDD